MDGSLGPSAQSVKDICKNILKNINIPFAFGMNDYLQLELLIYLVN